MCARGTRHSSYVRIYTLARGVSPKQECGDYVSSGEGFRALPALPREMKTKEKLGERDNSKEIRTKVSFDSESVELALLEVASRGVAACSRKEGLG